MVYEAIASFLALASIVPNMHLIGRYGAETIVVASGSFPACTDWLVVLRLLLCKVRVHVLPDRLRHVLSASITNLAMSIDNIWLWTRPPSPCSGLGTRLNRVTLVPVTHPPPLSHVDCTTVPTIGRLLI